MREYRHGIPDAFSEARNPATTPVILAAYPFRPGFGIRPRQRFEMRFPVWEPSSQTTCSVSSVITCWLIRKRRTLGSDGSMRETRI